MEEIKQIKEFLDIVLEQEKNFIDNIDYNSLIKAKNMILDAKSKGNRVHVTGIGKPSYVAGYIASLLSSTGTPAYKLDGTEAVHGSSGQVMEDDVVIAITNSGETKELVYAFDTLKKNGAKIIGVTGNKKSYIAKNCDVSLIAKVTKEGDVMNKPPRSSVIMETVMLQCLSILLQNEYHLTKEEYVKWHPGGALGKSIKEEKGHQKAL